MGDRRTKSARTASSRAASLVVFADIDQSSVASLSSPAAEEIAASEGMALVLCSSMTRAEVDACQRVLRIAEPFICESGAAVLIPRGYFPFTVPSDRQLAGYHVIEFGRQYEEVVAVLRRTSERLNIPVIGFHDLSVEQVAIECGLPLSQARLAKLREYDEAFRLADPGNDNYERLWRALRGARLARTHRGSFDHVGVPVEHATGVRLLTTLYQRARSTVITAALGDGASSASFLRRVGFPFVRHDHDDRVCGLLERVPRLASVGDGATLVDALGEVTRRVAHRDQG